MMKSYSLPFAWIAFVLMGCGVAQQPSGNLRGLERLVGRDRNLVALVYGSLANYKEDYLCMVTEAQDPAHASSAPRSLMIYPAKAVTDPSLKKVFEFTTADTLLAMYPYGGDRLITLWESGSAIRLNIFAKVAGEIKSVFNTGMSVPPEFADLDDDGSAELLVSRGAFLTSGDRVVRRPEKTEVYKWDGKSYTLVATVGWLERFEALKKAR